MSRFQFVADNSSTYPVKRLCELVEVPPIAAFVGSNGVRGGRRD